MKKCGICGVAPSAFQTKLGELCSTCTSQFFVPSSSGTKHDGGKPPMDLLPYKSLLEVAKVLGHGKKKYDAHNWRKGLAWSRVIAAVLRHLGAFNDGEDKDPESGLSHLAHAACGLLFLLEYEQTRKELDDRYKGESK